MHLTPPQRIGVVAVAAIIIVFAIVQLKPPERSVEAYCRVYATENAKLPHMGKDKYTAATLTSSSGNPHNFAVAFGKMEQVAPDEIRYDVKTLKAVFEKLDRDPTQALSASLSGLGAEMNVKDWTTDHCAHK